MLNKAIILILSTFLLSSCITGPEGYFKKSANNKLFDRKGFQGGKRAPLYNKKYIAKAKQNVANNDYEEEEEYDDLFENENISQANRDMYRKILEQEIESKYLGKGRKKEKIGKKEKDKVHPVLVRNSPRPVDPIADDNSKLKDEIDQIKVMLNETKNEMANYKCPATQELEKTQAKPPVTTWNEKNIIDNAEKKSEPTKQVKETDFPPESTIIHPVKSI